MGVTNPGMFLLQLLHGGAVLGVRPGILQGRGCRKTAEAASRGTHRYGLCHGLFYCNQAQQMATRATHRSLPAQAGRSHLGPPSLDGVINLVMEVGQRLHSHHLQTQVASLQPNRNMAAPLVFAPVSVPGPEVEPMLWAPQGFPQLQRHRQADLCLYCGKEGHFVASCPAKGGSPAKSGIRVRYG